MYICTHVAVVVAAVSVAVDVPAAVATVVPVACSPLGKPA